MKLLLSRRTFMTGAAAGAGLSAASAIRSARAADATFTLRYSIPLGPGSLYHAAATRLADMARQRSNGRLSIEVYSNGQLAKEHDSITGLQNGTVDLTTQATVWVSPLVPDFSAFDLPFLLRNVPSAYRFSESPLGSEVFSHLDPLGIVGLTWSPSGFRELETTTKAIVHPEDVKGLRIRIQAGPVYVAMIQALSGVPVTIDLAETYTALSQHTVDGLDVSLDAFANQKLYNVVKYIALSNHIFQFAPTMASKSKLAAIGPELTQVIKDSAAAAARFWWSLYSQRTIANINMLKSNGVTFTEIDFARFRKAMEPVYAAFEPKFSKGLVQRLSQFSNA